MKLLGPVLETLSQFPANRVETQTSPLIKADRGTVPKTEWWTDGCQSYFQAEQRLGLTWLTTREIHIRLLQRRIKVFTFVFSQKTTTNMRRTDGDQTSVVSMYTD